VDEHARRHDLHVHVGELEHDVLVARHRRAVQAALADAVEQVLVGGARDADGLRADGVVFVFKPEGGGKKQVFLAGNFNAWKPDNPQYLMTADATGTYTITVKLPPGTYQYKFVADGQWIKDPFSPGDAPDGFGGRNGQFDVK
jgi:hypothetical protein